MDGSALCCALLAAAVYWNTLDAGFVYDDRRAILRNPDVVGNATPSLRRLLAADFWGTPLSHTGSHGSWRPLVTLSFRAHRRLGGGWHAGNIAAHALCAALVARVARRLGCSPLLAGAAFALHPVHCEAVAGLVGRADVMAAACSLLALLCYARHVELRDARDTRRCRCRRCGAPLHRHSEPSTWRDRIWRFLAYLCHPHQDTPKNSKTNQHTNHHPTSPHSKNYSPLLSPDYNSTDAPVTEEENNNIMDSFEAPAHQNLTTHSPQLDDFNHKDIDNATYRDALNRPYNTSNGYATGYTVEDSTDHIRETNSNQHFSNNTPRGNGHIQTEIDTCTYRDTYHLTTGNTTSWTLDEKIPDSPQRDTNQPFHKYTLHSNDPNFNSSAYQNTLHQPNHSTNGHITSYTSDTTSKLNCSTHSHISSSRWYLEYNIRKLFQWSCRSSAVSKTSELATRTIRDSSYAPKTAMSEMCSLSGLSSAFLSDKLLTPVLGTNGVALSGSRREQLFKLQNNNNNTVISSRVSKNFRISAPVNERTETLLKRSSRRAKKRKRYRVDHCADTVTQSVGCLGCGRGPSTPASPVPALAACVALSACALLCKETGVAALAVCAAYDAALLHARGLTRPRLLLAHRCGRRALVSLTVVSVCLVCLVAARLAVSGFGGRVGFSRADNPVAGEPRLATRALTLLYVPAFCWLRLLLLPTQLCFDWGMSALPPLRSPLEGRAAAAAACYLALVAALKAALARPPQQVPLPARHSRAPVAACGRPRAARQTLTTAANTCITTAANINSTAGSCGPGPPLCTCSRCGVPGRAALLVCLSLMALPYAPASNALFYVGFVAAERVLYLPSAGHCLLLALGWARLRAATTAGGRRLHALLLLALAVTLASLGARTVVRNRDWHDEESLFRSALHINPPKAYGNLGSVLSSAGRLQEAEWALRQALRHRPNMADVHYNLGNLLVRLGRVEEAERSYRMAIQCRPSLAVAYVSLGRLLEAAGRRAEAAQLYEMCTRLSSDGLRDPAAHDAAAAAADRRLAQLLQTPPGRDTAASAAGRDLYRRAAEAPPGAEQQAAEPRSAGAARR